ncbi:MAG: hypothetical protein JWN66_2651 [Sphingomonas bacterium]|uniref:hypothetical protein n=1 Tax=Sphingomonas bacterium TaxID=1895847 RepID=UPI00262009F6|nr:hypothetical protein [Sphingomonas bacterium]MDB5705535.1 hypothetical protein [Sphingomonas bacterium]
MNDAASHQASKRVRAALETVYSTFDLPPPSVIEGCPCCISTRGTDVLLTTPLRQISGHALWRYVSGVFLTIGDKQDFRYLLPRILDVSVYDAGNANDPEIVLGKLPLAGWRSWAPNEQHAVEQFVDAWFEQALASDLTEADDGWIGTDAESVLCGAARAGMPLERWLMRLSEPSAAPVLAEMRERFPSEMSAFWEYVPSGLQELSTILGQGRA